MFVLKALPQATLTIVLLVQALTVVCHYDSYSYHYSSTTQGFDRCDPEVLSEAEGMFTSPRYPREYYNDAECSWHITVKSGSRVELNVQIDEIESHENCSLDAIMVYDGADENAALLAKECGYDKNITLLSTGNEMFVVFETDYSDQFDGFIANYVTISPGIWNMNPAPPSMPPGLTYKECGMYLN